MLSLALLAGVIGFAAWIFWVLALILMGSLWGMLVMEREHQPGTDKGVLAEMVMSSSTRPRTPPRWLSAG